MAGRPRKPDHLKLVTGTAQPCRMNSKAPKPNRERPSPPSHISDKAKSAWVEAALIADRMGVLTEADTLALEMLAEAVADIREARASLARPLVYRYRDGQGNEVEDVMADGGVRYYWTVGKGVPMQRARSEIADIADADRRIKAWVASFGMSPADRSRVSSANAEDVNEFAEFG